MTATLIDPDVLRKHFETDLDNASLQRIIDSADEAIREKFGEHPTDTAEVTDVFDQVNDPQRYIFPSQRIAAITSIIEEVDLVDVELDETEYIVELKGRAIRRRGNYWYWYRRTTVVYSPVTKISQRVDIEIKLCVLALQYSGLSSERAGDYASQSADYAAERDKLLLSLAPSGGMLVA